MTNVKSYTTKQLLDKVKSLPSFKGIPKNQYWLLGVQSNEHAENVPDDKFYLFFEETSILVAPGSVDAGSPSLRKTSKDANKDGTFVIAKDCWQYDLWKNGLHKGKMPALVQNRAVFGYRDNDKDGIAEELGPMTSGYFGINFHAMTYKFADKLVKKIIGLWSFGCQVVADRQKYNEIIKCCKTQSTITYCCIKEF